MQNPYVDNIEKGRISMTIKKIRHLFLMLIMISLVLPGTVGCKKEAEEEVPPMEVEFASRDPKMEPLTFLTQDDAYESQATINDVAVGDINGDGMADIVTATAEGVALLTATGSNSFSKKYIVTSGDIEDIYINDFTGDQHADIICNTAYDIRPLALCGVGRERGDEAP